MSKEELRAGRGNALWGQYFHTPTFDLKITDAMFNLEYLAANVGSEIETGGDIFFDEELKAKADGSVELSKTAVPINANSTVIYAYIREATNGGAKRQRAQVTGDNKLVGLTPDVAYCVRYMYNDGNSRKMTINSNFIPGTFSIVLTADLYSGDSCNVESATHVGRLTIKIPRFQLNGSQELSMSASGISNTSFEGSALASGCSSCDDTGSFAEIIETIFGALWYDNYNGLSFDEAEVEAKLAEFKVPYKTEVLAVPSSGAPINVTNDIIATKEAAVADADKTQLVFSIDAGSTGLTINASTGEITGTPAAGTATVTVELQNIKTATAIPGFTAIKTIELTA